jgi:hypothetical protein
MQVRIVPLCPPFRYSRRFVILEGHEFESQRGSIALLQVDVPRLDVQSHTIAVCV